MFWFRKNHKYSSPNLFQHRLRHPVWDRGPSRTSTLQSRHHFLVKRLLNPSPSLRFGLVGLGWDPNIQTTPETPPYSRGEIVAHFRGQGLLQSRIVSKRLREKDVSDR